MVYIFNEFAKHTCHSKNKIFNYEKQMIELSNKNNKDDYKITNLKNIVKLMKKDIECGHFMDIIEQKNKEKLIRIYENIIQDYYALRNQEKNKLKEKIKEYTKNKTYINNNRKIKVQLSIYKKMMQTETDPIKKISYQYLIKILTKLVR